MRSKVQPESWAYGVLVLLSDLNVQTPHGGPVRPALLPHICLADWETGTNSEPLCPGLTRERDPGCWLPVHAPKLCAALPLRSFDYINDSRT